MKPTFLSRLHAAAALIFKSGAPFPFNKIMPYDATGGEKMYRAFEQSTWVMRAIKKIAGPIAAVDLRFYAGGRAVSRAGAGGFLGDAGSGSDADGFDRGDGGLAEAGGGGFLDSG